MRKKATFSAFVVTALGVFLPASDGPPRPIRPRHEAAIASETPAVTPLEKRAPAAHRVVLVVLDGVRWQDVFFGVDPDLARTYMLPAKEVVPVQALVPTLHRLATDDGAAFGAPDTGSAMFASGPSYVSQPGYIEIFSERRPLGCGTNNCPATTEPTFVDAIAEATNGSAAVVSSWEIIARAATARPEGIVLSAGHTRGENQAQLRVNAQATHALEMGRIAASWPGNGEYRPDKYTAEIALAYLEQRRPRFLFVGLGDTDEYAHLGDYRGYLHALHQADTIVARILETLDRMGDEGRHTTVLVTTDHGRARGFIGHGGSAPESSRVWMIAGGNVKPQGHVALASPAHLYDVGPTVRELMGIAPGNGEGRALFGQPTKDPTSLSLAPEPPLPARSPASEGRAD